MEYVGEGGLQDIRARIFKRRGQVALNASGLATITFDPPIQLPREPFMQLTPRVTPSSAEKVIVNLVDGSFVTDGSGAYVSVQITGGRIRASLPVMGAVSGLLTAVITGVNAIITALRGLVLVNPANVSGTKVDWQAS